MSPESKWEALVERWVIDQDLDESQRAEIDALRREDPDREVEAALFEELSDFVDDAPPLDETALRPSSSSSPLAAAPAATQARPPEPASRRPWIAAIATVAAIAAAGLVWVWVDREVELDGPQIATTSGDVRIDAARPGDPLAPGDEIEIREGSACLSFEAGIWACADEGTLLSVGSDRADDLELVVHRGRVTARLEPLAKGHRFSMRAAHVRATAVGTIFTVEHDPDEQRVEARVVEGTIELDVRGSVLRLEEHRGAVVRGGNVELAELADSAEASDLLVLRGSKEPARAQSVSRPAQSRADTRTGTTTATSGAEPSEAGPPRPASNNANVEVTSNDRAPSTIETGGANPAVSPRPISRSDPATMLASARTALDQGNNRQAARIYRALLRAHPRSVEAQAARVSLGDLYLNTLGKPRQAERLYSAYLVRGGPLALQARYGRAIALKRQRSPKERQAIQDFLRAHPNSGYAPSLRARLKDL